MNQTVRDALIAPEADRHTTVMAGARVVSRLRGTLLAAVVNDSMEVMT